MQLYWHTTKPSYAAFETVPENRVYVSPQRADAFTRSFLRFSRGKVVSDDPRAPGVEIGRPDDTYRRIRIESVFGKMTVFVTDGHLPYPYGRELDRLRGGRSQGHVGQGDRIRSNHTRRALHVRAHGMRRWCSFPADISPRFTRPRSSRWRSALVTILDKLEDGRPGTLDMRAGSRSSREQSRVSRRSESRRRRQRPQRPSPSS